jgi:hypothetical protein
MSDALHRFSFALYVSGISTEGAYEDALFEAGCDDALVCERGGELFLDFDRQAESYERAVASARRDVERAGGEVVRSG